MRMMDMRTQIPDIVIMRRKRRPQTMAMRTLIPDIVIMNRKLSPLIQIMYKTMEMEEQGT